jgi:hypothetical protein
MVKMTESFTQAAFTLIMAPVQVGNKQFDAGAICALLQCVCPSTAVHETITVNGKVPHAPILTVPISKR